MISEKERKLLIKLWTSKKFHGAFSGATIFHRALKSEGINVPLKDVISVLHSIPSYIYRVRKPKIPKTRPYRIVGVNKLWEVDLAHMNALENGYKYIFVCVDVFSRKLFTVALKNKLREGLKEALKKCFQQNYGRTPDKLQGDGEFAFMRQWLSDQNIGLGIKTRRNKAAMAEHFVFLLKKRLYFEMSHEENTDWSKILQTTTKNMNDSPSKALDGLKPSSIRSEYDDPFVWKHAKKLPKLIPWEIQWKNQEEYEKKPSEIQVGDLVLYNMTGKGKRFEFKSYQTKVKLKTTFLARNWLAAYIAILLDRQFVQEKV